MKRGLVCMLCTIVVSLFGIGSIRPMAAGTGMPPPPPDIMIHFDGLMVFDGCTTTPHLQVFRLHSDAPSHSVSILIKGPGIPQFREWGRVYPKQATLKLEVWDTPSRLPIDPVAIWGSKDPDKIPYNITHLHPDVGSYTHFGRVAGAFGPTFTFNAGTFIGNTPTSVIFANAVDPGRATLVPTMVNANITLSGTQIALLTAENLPAGVVLPPVRLTKPTGADRWEIQISVDPDLGHACEYHFLEYYRGFRYAEAEVPIALRYVARPEMLGGGPSPCDPRPLKAEVERYQKGITALPSYPCIPISD